MYIQTNNRYIYIYIIIQKNKQIQKEGKTKRKKDTQTDTDIDSNQGQGPVYHEKPIAAFLEYGDPMTQVDVQLALRGLFIPGITVKPLLTNSAPDRPPLRTDGYGRTGPYGLSIISTRPPAMSSTPKPPDPPLPPPPLPTNPYAQRVRGVVVLPPPKAVQSMAMCSPKPSTSVPVTVPKPSKALAKSDVKSVPVAEEPKEEALQELPVPTTMRSKAVITKTMSTYPMHPPKYWVGPGSMNRVSWSSGIRI